MAARYCGCGEHLCEDGARLVCRRCGDTEAWVLRTAEGEAVAAGSHSELYVSPRLLTAELGITAAILEAASRPDFRPVRDGTERG